MITTVLPCNHLVDPAGEETGLDPFTDKTVESQGFVQGHTRGTVDPGTPTTPQSLLLLWTHPRWDMIPGAGWC